jgi:hypothetical protein
MMERLIIACRAVWIVIGFTYKDVPLIKTAPRHKGVYVSLQAFLTSKPDGSRCRKELHEGVTNQLHATEIFLRR